MAEMRRDYAAMGVMIFGERVPFAEIVRGVGELEREVNAGRAVGYRSFEG